MNTEANDQVDPFWHFLEQETGGLPGQKGWKKTKRPQWTDKLNSDAECVGVYIGNAELICMYITGSTDELGEGYARRMKRYSQTIIDEMSDQQLGSQNKTIDEMTVPELEKFIDGESAEGRSIKVRKAWKKNDTGGWSDAARWIKIQFEKLHEIVTAVHERKQ